MANKLTKATGFEFNAFFWGWAIACFGLGALLVNYIQRYALWIFLIGLFVHGWAWFKIHLRK